VHRKRVGVRILVSFATNIIRLVLSFFTGLLIARVLIPSAYGDYSFLLGSFSAIAGLLDMGTSTAFFTFVAQRQRGLRFVAYYGLWLCMQLAMMVAFVVVLPDRILVQIWLGQPRGAVLLALFMTFSMNQLWTFTSQLGESARDTVGVQARNLLASACYLAIVVGLARAGWARVETLLLAGGALYVTLALAYAAKLYRQAVFPPGQPVNTREMLADFAAYCYPSVVVAGFAYTFLDGYFLQRFSGSVQQGYYGVTSRFASVALLMSGATVQVLWKEIAEANAAHNTARVKYLLRAFSRGLVFMTAVLGAALLPFAEDVLAMTVGPAYVNAWLPFSIMMIYPVYQAMNVTHDVALLAIAETRTRNRILLGYCGISLIAGYLFLAPRMGVVPGLELGATGLAAKVLICGLLQANVAAYFAWKCLGGRFEWKHQIAALLVLVPLGFATKAVGLVVTGALSDPIRRPATMGVATVLYLAAVVALVRRAPDLTGLTDEQLRTNARRAWDRLKLA
jgi:O-antigen/teichoic acid export membrane protein